ncbi:MAG: threonine synthase [Vicinamibacterales bacterium]|nr:threonine synthase [Vicinamibacterales bacterium]
MRLVSTRGRSPVVSFGDALLAGLAPDGGLYVPESIDPYASTMAPRLRGASLVEVATEIGMSWFGDEIPRAEWTALVSDALNFETPIVTLGPGLHVLELFHGPTFAFKDVGARTMARLLARFHGAGDPITVLVATSGDTGSAVAQAFHGVAGTRVVVLYPEGQVTPVQEAQFTTLGGNVTAVAVAGTFDDCQRLAKAAFASPELGERVRLTSANSISIGRLLPQSFYFAWASLQMPEAPIVSVPSGNFGNLMAGVLAWQLGFPLRAFVAATTINDVVPQYLATGRFEPQPSRPTLANAMDVGNPSNLERLRWAFSDDVESMRKLIRGRAFTDDEVRGAIRDVWERYGYVCDPHTAIGYLGATEVAAGTTSPRLILATAHPAKFREAVEPALGRPVPLPPALEEALGRERHIVRIAAEDAALAEVL